MAGGGIPHLSKSRVIYTSKPELLLYIWCCYSLSKLQFKGLLDDSRLYVSPTEVSVSIAVNFLV